MKKLLFILLTFALVACNSRHQNINWPTGEWEEKSMNQTTTETWSQENALKYVGKNWVLNEDQLVFQEDLCLEVINGQWIYTAAIGSGQEIEFTLKSSADSLWVFENPDHDYPQKIIYRLRPGGMLEATISLIDDNKPNMWRFSPSDD